MSSLNWDFFCNRRNNGHNGHNGHTQYHAADVHLVHLVHLVHSLRFALCAPPLFLKKTENQLEKIRFAVYIDKYTVFNHIYT